MKAKTSSKKVRANPQIQTQLWDSSWCSKMRFINKTWAFKIELCLLQTMLQDLPSLKLVLLEIVWKSDRNNTFKSLPKLETWINNKLKRLKNISMWKPSKVGKRSKWQLWSTRLLQASEKVDSMTMTDHQGRISWSRLITLTLSVKYLLFCLRMEKKMPKKRKPPTPFHRQSKKPPIQILTTQLQRYHSDKQLAVWFSPEINKWKIL
jgi:hypothetical protein